MKDLTYADIELEIAHVSRGAWDGAETRTYKAEPLLRFINRKCREAEASAFAAAAPKSVAVTVVPNSVRDGIRNGYEFWCVVRNTFSWHDFIVWAKENLPQYPTAREDCMGGSYTVMTHHYMACGGDPRWLGFTTRAERDKVIDAFGAELPPTGADQLYEMQK